MSGIRSYRDLEAWQVAMDAVTETYQVSVDFPKAETYGLMGQMRRAAVSVPSNIAEGQARTGRAGLNYIGIAIGSLAELDTQLDIALRLTYVSAERVRPLRKSIDSARRLLYGLRRARRLRLGLSVATHGSWILLAIRLFG
jgi:four helix bundle protein